MPRPLRVLCLDIEGGYGGSSRSLFYLVKHLNRDLVSPEIWCKRAGPIQAMYEALGIRVRIEPRLPKVSSLPRLSRSLYAHSLYAIDFPASAELRARMTREINDRFDVVHFNHEALYLLSRWLRQRTPRAAFAMHNRTMLVDSWFARRQARILVTSNDANVFITQRERDNIRRLAAWSGGFVVNNVVEIPESPLPRGEGTSFGSGFKVACLSNYSWMRGIDRLVDVAVALRDMGQSAIRFVIGGKIELSGGLPGLLGKIAARHGTLADYVAARGVGEMFIFLGHVPDPERVLAACDVLAKPSREDNPWGRDILEALAMARPVLACGTCEEFVAPGATGFLYPHGLEFDPSRMAADIVRLAAAPALLRQMGVQAQERVRDRCDGPSCATDLLNVWMQAVACRDSERQ
jgi:glycosyltransferase involved in cell wall biosynthesis